MYERRAVRERPQVLLGGVYDGAVLFGRAVRSGAMLWRQRDLLSVLQVRLGLRGRTVLRSRHAAVLLRDVRVYVGFSVRKWKEVLRGQVLDGDVLR